MERFIQILILAALVLSSLSGCSDSSEPAPIEPEPTEELTGPCFEAGVGLFDLSCPPSVDFFLETDCCEDAGQWTARWDFENDGVWDTGIEPFESRYQLELSVLPDDVWTLRCRAWNAAGDSVTMVRDVEVPDWVPRAPDLIASHIYIQNAARAQVDTLAVGEPFWVVLMRRDWLLPTNQYVIQDFLIDGEVVASSSVRTDAPIKPSHCKGIGHYFGDGLAEPGAHEISVVIDSTDHIAETREDNNSLSATVIVQ